MFGDETAEYGAPYLVVSRAKGQGWRARSTSAKSWSTSRKMGV